jgi:hypothetical protein
MLMMAEAMGVDWPSNVPVQEVLRFIVSADAHSEKIWGSQTPTTMMQRKVVQTDYPV